MNLLGGTSLFWKGGLAVGFVPGEPPVEPPANEPPVAETDAVTVIEGGSILIDVLLNDTDPEGGALTVVGAVAEHGSVTVQDDRLLYTATSGFAGEDTITYTIRDSGGNTAQALVAVTVTAPTLAIHQDDSTGDFTVDAETGEITMTVIEPEQFAGIYVVKTDDLALGPVNLAPPIVDGERSAGATVTAFPGLWAYDEAHGPIEFGQLWYRGDTMIAGATEDSYVIQPEDVAEGLRHVRSAEQGAGTRTAEVVVLAPPSSAEQGVVFGPDACLVRNDNLGPDSAAVLFFASFVPRTAAASGILSLPGGLGLGVSGDQKLRLRLDDGASSTIRKGLAIAAGQRCHVLAAAGPNERGTTTWQMWSRQGSETEWSPGFSTMESSPQTFNFSQGSFVVGANDATVGFMDATTFRIACWVGASVPDIADPAVREAFVAPDGKLEDPATSRTRYGIPRVDLHGPASDYVAGINHGTAGNFDTMTGTFTDA